MSEPQPLSLIIARYIDPTIQDRATLETILAAVGPDQRELFATLARVKLHDQATAEYHHVLTKPVVFPQDVPLMDAMQLRELKEELIQDW